jgi:PA domain
MTTTLSLSLPSHRNVIRADLTTKGKDPSDTNGNDDTNVDDFVNSRVEVHIPAELRSSKGFDHVKADFGFGSTMLSSGSIHSFVYMVDSPLCDPISIRPHQGINITDNRTNETISYDYDAISVYPKPRERVGAALFKTPFILMARSEHCSPVTKVRNAQAVGASALVIANEYCQCEDTDCTERYGNTKCTDDPIYLVNDGSAGDISIPSFLLYKDDAANIMEAMMHHNQTVLMELTWGLQPIKDDVVSSDPIRYHLWTTAHDPLLDHEALRAIRLVDKAFTNEEAIFSPHYMVLDGSRFGCTGDASSYGDKNYSNPACDELCTNHGRYCTVHTKSLNGYQILQETVRQMCIWRLYSSTDDEHPDGGDSDIYWEYIMHHRKHCRGLNEYDNDKCIIEAYEHAGIPLDYHKRSKIIEDCMNQVGDLKADSTNPLLEYHVDTTMEYGIVQVPTMTVNKHELNVPTADELFHTICAQFSQNVVTRTQIYPKICDTCGNCANVVGCLEQGKCVPFQTNYYEQRMKNTRRRSFFWTMFTMIVLGGVCYSFYVKYYRGGNYTILGIDRQFLLSSYLRGD